MSFRIICSSRPSGGNFQEAIEFALTHGFNGIEYYLDYARLPIASGAASKLKTLINSANLPFKFHAPCTDVELGHIDEEVRRVSLLYLQQYINAIASLGGTEITIHLGSKSIDPREMDLEGGIDAVSSLVRYGEANGVTVCLENLKVGWTADPRTYNLILTESGASATFDIGHANASELVRNGTLNAVELVNMIKAPIRTVHAYEIETPSGVHVHPENLDNIGEVIEALVERGCDWFVIELQCYDYVPSVKQLLERLRDDLTR